MIALLVEIATINDVVDTEVDGRQDVHLAIVNAANMRLGAVIRRRNDQS